MSERSHATVARHDAVAGEGGAHHRRRVRHGQGVDEGLRPRGARVVAAREADVAEACRTAVAEFGHLDIVLNVAGIGGPQPLHELDMDAYDRTFDVNLRGVLLGMKYGIRTMLAGRHGGAIVNWSSVGGLGASTFGTSVYAASKAGVTSATKSAAVEYGDRGIRVNAIWPGFILTEIMGAAGAEHGGWSARLA